MAYSNSIFIVCIGQAHYFILKFYNLEWFNIYREVVRIVKSSHIPYIHGKILDQDGSFVTINEPNIERIFRFPQFLLSVLFLFQEHIQDTTVHLVVMSPQAPLDCDSFSDFFLVLMTLKVLRSTGKVFCRLSLNWDLSNFFLMIILRSWVLGRKTTEVILITS